MSLTSHYFKIGPEKQAAFVKQFREQQIKDRVTRVKEWRERIARYRNRGWDDLADADEQCLDKYLADWNRRGQPIELVPISNKLVNRYDPWLAQENNTNA